MGRTSRKRKRKKLCVNSNQNRCDNEEEVLHLLQWLGIRTHLQLYHFRETGRGLRTKKNLLNGEVLISIPLDKMITRNSLVKLSDFNYPLHWSTQLMLSCFLIRESTKIKQMCSAKSKWKIYLETLPQNYDVPYFDCPQDLLIYLPRHLKVSIEEQFRLIDTQFKEIVKVLKEENVSKEKFAWAWFTVNTRGVYFKDGYDNLALAPFLDMFNHSCQVAVQVEKTEHFYNLKSSNNFPKHSQVFINYGPHDNLKLYQEYGFIVPENPQDCVTFILEDFMETLATNFSTGNKVKKISNKISEEEKLKFIKTHQLDSKLQLVKNEELVSWSVLACLHVLQCGNSSSDNVVQPNTNVSSYQEGPNSNKNRYQQINSELLQVFQLDLSWKMFKSELQLIANCLKNQIEDARNKLPNFQGSTTTKISSSKTTENKNRLNCQVLPKLLDIQHDICSFVVRMLEEQKINF